MARPLQKTYSESQPYVVQRHDQEDGSIDYDIWDERPESYRRLCTISDEYSLTRGQAKKDARLIIHALNLNLNESPDVIKALTATSHALKSYAYGNASPDLAASTAAFVDEVIKAIQAAAMEPYK